MGEEQRKSASVCTVCLGSGRVFGFAVVDGRSREVWMSCARCNGPQRVVSGPR